MSVSTIEIRDSALHRNAARSSLLRKESDSYKNSVELFDLTIANTNLREAADDLIEAARAGRRTRVSFVNSHVINVAATNPAYARVLHGADRLYTGGCGMALAARWIGSPLADNVNGADLFPLLCAAAAKAGLKIFLLGGKPGVAAAAANTVKAMGHDDVIVGTHHGSIESPADKQAAIEEINASGAAILLVGMGVPMQDIWIARNFNALQTPVVLGVGGLFELLFRKALARAGQLALRRLRAGLASAAGARPYVVALSDRQRHVPIPRPHFRGTGTVRRATSRRCGESTRVALGSA